MKVKVIVTYLINNDEGDDDQVEGKTYEEMDPEDQDVLDCMQHAADELENEGITVDHGGDDDTYELSLPDPFDSREEAIEVAQRLLDLVEENLNELERERS